MEPLLSSTQGRTPAASSKSLMIFTWNTCSIRAHLVSFLDFIPFHFAKINCRTKKTENLDEKEQLLLVKNREETSRNLSFKPDTLVFVSPFFAIVVDESEVVLYSASCSLFVGFVLIQKLYEQFHMEVCSS